MFVLSSHRVLIVTFLSRKLSERHLHQVAPQCPPRRPRSQIAFANSMKWTTTLRGAFGSINWGHLWTRGEHRSPHVPRSRNSRSISIDCIYMSKIAADSSRYARCRSKFPFTNFFLDLLATPHKKKVYKKINTYLTTTIQQKNEQTTSKKENVNLVNP